MSTPRLAPRRLLATLGLTALSLTFASAPASAGEPSPYSVAPYVDMADYPPPNLGPMGQASGARALSLGFVTARDRDARDRKVDPLCEPTWGGYADYGATGVNPYLLDRVEAFRAQAGATKHVVLSFGGAAGTELAEACGTPLELASAYQAAIDAYSADRVDFDIEGDELDAGSSAANERRSDAIAMLHSGNDERPLEVTYTLPVGTGGLQGLAAGLLADALDAGIEIEAVNAMAMDYGTTPRKPDMGRLAIGVAGHLADQLTEIYEDAGAPLSADEAWAKVAITPMIGINDVKREIFTLADGRELARFASARGLGMLGMWQITRDTECKHRTSTTEPRCSGVRQRPYAFTRALGRFTG